MTVRPLPIREDPDAFLRIDPRKLDAEWRELPSLYGCWAKKYAEQKRQVRLTKAAMRYTRLKLAQKIRKNPAAYGLGSGRVTKVWLDQTISRQEAIREAEERLDEYEYEVELVQAVLNSIRYKKEALQDLVRMHLSAFYVEGSTLDEARASVLEDESEERSEGIRRRTPRKHPRRRAGGNDGN